MAERTGILLLQMGGPRRLEEIEDYIRQLFLDPDLVRLPVVVNWFRRSLADKVARKRAPEVRKQYQLIGGGSPNNEITERQARLLQEALAEDGDFRCYAAMTYTSPLIDEAVLRAHADGCRSVIGLSLFPQYSTATTRSSFRLFDDKVREHGYPANRVRRVDRWSTRADYLDALAERSRQALEQARAAHAEEPQLVVSAHGIPVSYVKRGDPYVDEIEASVAGLRERLPETEVHLAYQSRATPVKWVPPATIDELARLGREGARNLVVLPISFVNDHVETLFEIDIQLAEVAREAGVEAYRRVPVFNDSADLTAILRRLVLETCAED